MVSVLVILITLIVILFHPYHPHPKATNSQNFLSIIYVIYNHNNNIQFLGLYNLEKKHFRNFPNKRKSGRGMFRENEVALMVVLLVGLVMWCRCC